MYWLGSTAAKKEVMIKEILGLGGPGVRAKRRVVTAERHANL